VGDITAGDGRGPPEIAVGADDDAYVYYTSGSTGRPKGVVDTHRNVLHNILRYTDTLRIARDDRLTLIQGPSFSGAVSSLFGAILNGASIHPWDLHRDGLGGLADWVRRSGITMWHSVPGIFRVLTAGAALFPSVRVIRLEGDLAAAVDAARLRASFAPDCVLVNGLGATECGLVRQFFVGHDTPGAPGPLPIGHAVPDMSVAIVDEAGEPAPAGTIGEIVVTSAYLARGYWRQEAATAAAFAAVPGSPTRRRYRTGDLGVMAADGAITHLGRADFQEKIRGERVDVGAVEAAIVGRGLAREAVVRTWRGTDDTSRLVAYLVGADTRFDVRAARRSLRPDLPPVALPAAFVRLEDWPRDDNGKIDRKALPAPAPEAPPASRAPARSALEAAIAGLWTDILGWTAGGDADFWEAGGDSIAAMRLIAAIEEVFGVVLELSAVLDAAPTIADLARLIAEKRRR